jgi:phosphoribosylformylglycinamidine cyclo-ligase
MSQTPSTQGLSYQAAGVNIDAGNQLVEQIKGIAQATRRPEVLSGLGGFSAFCELPAGYQQPVLTFACDGVGTKLRLAITCHALTNLGIDLVAMSANDLLVSGAKPLYFLDYYACGQLSVEAASEVIKGIGVGCQQAGCALVGGETAEMPGLYANQDFDLAGFCAGIVEKSKIIDGSHISPGNQLIGLASSGPHANGYSLIRKILTVNNIDLTRQPELAEQLLAPTRIYVQPIMSLLDTHSIYGMAHITGGGLLENLPRILPNGTQAVIDPDSWPRPAIFNWLQQQGQLTSAELFRTFNCGIGMVLVVPEDSAKAVMDQLQRIQQPAWLIGYISASEHLDPHVQITGLNHG